jgi:hypothetical protein
MSGRKAGSARLLRRTHRKWRAIAPAHQARVNSITQSSLGGECFPRKLVWNGSRQDCL